LFYQKFQPSKVLKNSKFDKKKFDLSILLLDWCLRQNKVAVRKGKLVRLVRPVRPDRPVRSVRLVRPGRLVRPVIPVRRDRPVGPGRLVRPVRQV
jgi:hypothetical protein